MTGPGDGYQVDPAQLEQHAQRVRGIGDSVAHAAAAARSVGFGGSDAYGLLLSHVIPPALHLFVGDCTKHLDAAADLARAMADGLKADAANYRQAEEANQQVVADLHTPPGTAPAGPRG